MQPEIKQELKPENAPIVIQDEVTKPIQLPLSQKIMKMAKDIENSGTVSRLVEKNLGVKLFMDRSFFEDLELELQKAKPEQLQMLFKGLVRALFGADADEIEIKEYFNS